MKVRKWIGLGDFKTYEEFVKDWHYFLEKLETALEGQESDSPFSRNVSLYVLKSFYQTPYDLEKDFYPQFYERLGEAKKIFG